MPNENIGTGALAIGTIFHAFLELYYGKFAKKEFDCGAVKFSDVPDESDRIEAERLFRYYRLHHTPDEWGKIIELETVHEISLGDDLLYTMKADLVVQPGRQEVRLIQKQRGIELQPGSLYLVDHKTLGQWDGSSVDRYVNSMQFTLYQWAWNQLFPKTPVHGLIVNVMLKYKNPEVRTLLVSSPSEAQIKASLSFLRHCKEMRDALKDRPNPLEENCFPKGRICSWFANGMCDRY